MGKTLRGAPLIQKEGRDMYCIEILYKALEEFHIPKEFCSIGEYAEEAVCLEKNDTSWIVYEGERGKKYNIRTHVNCRNACQDVIARVAESVDDEKKLTEFFNLECEKNRFSQSGYKGCQFLKADHKTDILPITGTEDYEKKVSRVLAKNPQRTGVR